MWLEKVNAAGGINVGGTKSKVQLVQYDYQSDGQRAAQLAEKLITDDKVDFLLSPFGSGHTKIVATIATRYETPIIACAASSGIGVRPKLRRFLYGTLSPNAGLFGPMVKYFQREAAVAEERGGARPRRRVPESDGAGHFRCCQGRRARRLLRPALRGRHDGPLGVAVGDQARQSGLGLRHRLHAGPDPGAQADAGSRREGADHHDARRPGLQGIHRRPRQSRERRHQLELVASGHELQGRRRLADDRGLLQASSSPRRKAIRTTSTRRARRPRSSCRTRSSGPGRSTRRRSARRWPRPTSAPSTDRSSSARTA